MASGGGRLSTHILDTARGRPAAGVMVELYRLDGDCRARLGSATTNADGRTDAPLLAGADLVPGSYELLFHVGAYLAADPPFLDQVPVRFTVADPNAHYHVPLLIAPYGYSTYRGS